VVPVDDADVFHSKFFKPAGLLDSAGPALTRSPSRRLSHGGGTRSQITTGSKFASALVPPSGLEPENAVQERPVSDWQ
jgi:hypothetical protein